MDEFGKLTLQILSDEKLKLRCRETSELLCQSIKNRRVISPFFGKGLDDANGFRHERFGFVPAKFILQRIPFIELLKGIREIDGRVHQKILCYADLPLV